MHRLFPVCLISLLITGCTSEVDEISKAVSAPVAQKNLSEPDDAAAVHAIAHAGGTTKTNTDGQIVEVNLRDSMATDETLVAIRPLKHVRSLLLNNLEISDEGLEALTDVTWPLSNLDLRGCPVTNDGLRSLTGLQNLKALRLSGTHSAATVDDDGMDAVAQISDLKVLSLDKLWVSNDGVRALSTLKHLEELYLAGTTIGDGALEFIATMPAIRKLRLSNDSISDDGLKNLSALQDLVELDISEDSLLTDSGMQHLSGLTKLQKLNLWRVQIGDTGVQYLKPLTNLKWLNLDNTRLSDAGLPALKGMQNLTFLHLGSTSVSDAGLIHLTGLTALRDLKVTRCGVTKEGAAELKQTLNNTEIQTDYLANN